MTKEEHESLKYDYAPTVLGVDFKNMEPRTLLYGYNLNRDTLHVYLCKRGFIHIYIYNTNEDISYDYTRAAEISELIPSKRLYPECCDLEVCRKLKKWGYELPFTSFNKERERKMFYGKIKEDER